MLGLIGSDTAYAKFQEGYTSLSGWVPINEFSNVFSMLVDWDINLPISDPEKFGCYQVILEWTYVIHTLQMVYHGESIAYQHDYAFTMTETSYINFIYEPI